MNATWNFRGVSEPPDDDLPRYAVFDLDDRTPAERLVEAITDYGKVIAALPEDETFLLLLLSELRETVLRRELG